MMVGLSRFSLSHLLTVRGCMIALVGFGVDVVFVVNIDVAGAIIRFDR